MSAVKGRLVSPRPCPGALGMEEPAQRCTEFLLLPNGLHNECKGQFRGEDPIGAITLFLRTSSPPV